MEPDQARQLEQRFAEVSKKTFLLGHFSHERPVTEIADPYGGTAEEFVECYRVLTDACEGFLSHFDART